MTNTPIYRMPLEDMSEMQILNAEDHAAQTLIADALLDIVNHDTKENSLSITLDWAMQLREKTGQNWGWCLRAAQIAYYG